MKALTAVLALAAAVAQTVAPTKSELDVAVARVTRHAPDRFAALPPTVRDAFNTAGCRVPQMTDAASPHNVVAGQFAATGQRDWAALCSDGTFSQVRIVWGGPLRCEDGVGARQDSDSMVLKGPRVIGYARRISVAAPEQVTRLLLRARQSLGAAAAVDHDAIEDVLPETTTVHYCRSGRWITVP